MYGKVEIQKKEKCVGKLKKKKKAGEQKALLCICKLFRNAARRRTNACSKYNVQVHIFSFTAFGKRFLEVQLG